MVHSGMSIRRAPSGLLLHDIRDVSPRRVMHVTSKVHRDVRWLRSPRALDKIWTLLDGVKARGVRILVVQIMGSHIHLGLMPTSREALHNAMRFFFGLLARFLNKLNHRQGQVFTDRFASRVARSAVELFHLLGYIARNPKDAHMRVSPRSWDCGFWVNDDAFTSSDYLSGIFGTCQRAFRKLVWRMRFEQLPYQRLPDVRQLTLALA